MKNGMKIGPTKTQTAVAMNPNVSRNHRRETEQRRDVEHVRADHDADARFVMPRHDRRDRRRDLRRVRTERLVAEEHLSYSKALKKALASDRELDRRYRAAHRRRLLGDIDSEAAGITQ